MKGKRIGKGWRFTILDLRFTILYPAKGVFNPFPKSVNRKSQIVNHKSRSQDFLPEAQLSSQILAGLLTCFSG